MTQKNVYKSVTKTSFIKRRLEKLIFTHKSALKKYNFLKIWLQIYLLKWDRFWPCRCIWPSCFISFETGNKKVKNCILQTNFAYAIMSADWVLRVVFVLDGNKKPPLVWPPTGVFPGFIVYASLGCIAVTHHPAIWRIWRNDVFYILLVYIFYFYNTFFKKISIKRHNLIGWHKKTSIKASQKRHL